VWWIIDQVEIVFCCFCTAQQQTAVKENMQADLDLGAV